MSLAAEESGLSKEYIEEHGGSLPSRSFLRMLLQGEMIAGNYHVSLDSGILGEERCVRLIVGLAKEL